jgi:sugar (pentulose or hexulose) kinase
MTQLALLAVDVGTTAIKAAVYAGDGRLLSVESSPSQVLRPRHGWSEQDMAAVWNATKACIARVVARVDASNISAIGVCGQGDGLWALDDQLRPVRNAILWNDSRADELVLGWSRSGVSAELSRFSRTSNWAGTAGTAFRWLKENEPRSAARVECVLFCKDWINFQLTGNLATDFSDASIPFLDLETRTYADEAFDLLGVAELKGKVALPRRATDLHGSLLPSVAADLGLRSGLPVATGAIDVGAMMAGMRLNDAGAVGLILGTTAMVNVVVDPEPFGGEPIGATICHPFNDRWIRVIAPLSGASTVDWFTSVHRRTFGDDPREAAMRISDLAREVPAGANGVTFLPYLAGERAPFVAPHATASFHGLTARSTKADMGRAVMEGTSFSLKHCFRSIKITNLGHAFLTGGGARNALWCDILASVLGTTIVASDASDHGLWGAALIGASAAGLCDLESRPVRDEKTRVHRPDLRDAEAYERLFGRYEQIVAASRQIWDAQRAFERGQRAN